MGAIVNHATSIVCRYRLGLTSLPNYTAWRQTHNGVNHLPKESRSSARLGVKRATSRSYKFNVLPSQRRLQGSNHKIKTRRTAWHMRKRVWSGADVNNSVEMTYRRRRRMLHSPQLASTDVFSRCAIWQHFSRLATFKRNAFTMTKTILPSYRRTVVNSRSHDADVLTVGRLPARDVCVSPETVGR